jgi:hypothetical protein
MKDLKTYYGLFRDWHCYDLPTSNESKALIKEIEDSQLIPNVNNDTFETIISNKEFFYIKNQYGLEYGTFEYRNNCKDTNFKDFLDFIVKNQEEVLNIFKATNTEAEKTIKTNAVQINIFLIFFII